MSTLCFFDYFISFFGFIPDQINKLAIYFVLGRENEGKHENP